MFRVWFCLIRPSFTPQTPSCTAPIGWYAQHDRNVDKVDDDENHGSPEGPQVATANTLAKKDTMMVIVFDAHATVVTVIRFCVRINLTLATVDVLVGLITASTPSYWIVKLGSTRIGWGGGGLGRRFLAGFSLPERRLIFFGIVWCLLWFWIFGHILMLDSRFNICWQIIFTRRNCFHFNLVTLSITFARFIYPISFLPSLFKHLLFKNPVNILLGDARIF